MTKKEMKALDILVEAYPNYISARQFAEEFWGDDPKNQHLLRPHGNAPYWAGAYLQKLVRKGWVKQDKHLHYSYTIAGWNALWPDDPMPLSYEKGGSK